MGAKWLRCRLAGAQMAEGRAEEEFEQLLTQHGKKPVENTAKFIIKYGLDKLIELLVVYNLTRRRGRKQTDDGEKVGRLMDSLKAGEALSIGDAVNQLFPSATEAERKRLIRKTPIFSWDIPGSGWGEGRWLERRPTRSKQ